MKRRDVMRRLRQIAQSEGLELKVREGSRHTVVAIGDRIDVVPRHNEINEHTARRIIRKMEG